MSTEVVGFGLRLCAFLAEPQPAGIIKKPRSEDALGYAETQQQPD